MSRQVSLSKIKHSSKVVEALSGGSLFFADLQKATSLDAKSLQTVLARLQKNAYIEKTDRGLWTLSS